MCDKAKAVRNVINKPAGTTRIIPTQTARSLYIASARPMMKYYIESGLKSHKQVKSDTEKSKKIYVKFMSENKYEIGANAAFLKS